MIRRLYLDEVGRSVVSCAAVLRNSFTFWQNGGELKPSSESGRFVAAPSYVPLSVSLEKHELEHHGSLRTVMLVPSLVFTFRKFFV